MAEKGWTARVTAAAAAAAGIGAAQLGLGYGLGVVIWPSSARPDDSVWLGSLGWATWITASATVFGAVLAARIGGRATTRLRGPWRVTLAVSAAVGALVAVALIALPARAAVRADTFSPQVIAGGYAVIGLALGLVVAYWAVVSRPVAANLIVTAAWLWALAIAAVIVELTLHRTSATYLTSWQFAESGGDHRYGTIYWPSAVLTLGAALLIGIVAVAPAVRRRELGAGAAASGAVGPLLVAGAFFVLAPQLTGALGPLESAYLIAPYAVISGLAGSALTVALGQAAARRRIARAAARENIGDDHSEPDGGARSAGPQAADPAEPADAAPDGRIGNAPAEFPAQRIPAGTKSARKAGVAAAAAPSSTPDTDRAELSAAPDPDVTAPGPTAATQAGPRPGAPGRPAARAAAKPSPTAQPAAKPGSAAPAAARPAGKPSPTARPAGKPSPTARPATKSSPPATEPIPADRPAAGAAPAARRPGPTGKPAPSTRSDEADKKPTALSSAPAPVPVNRQPTAPPPANPPAVGESPDAVVDAEIAAAARRGRPKKATPAEPVAPKAPISTVTPPPASPTIAQINPKPPAVG